MFIQLPQNEKMLCEVLGYEQPIFGALELIGKDVRLTTVQFGSDIRINDNKETSIILEDGNFLTMFENMEERYSQNFGTVAIAKQQITCNIAVIGKVDWKIGDLTRTVYVRIKAVEELFQLSETYRQVLYDRDRKTDRILFASRTSCGFVQAWLGVTFDQHSRLPKSATPYFQIDFREGATLDQARAAAYHLTSLISILCGVSVSATEMSVSKFEPQQDENSMLPSTTAPTHSIYLYSEIGNESRSGVKQSNNLLCLHAPEARAALEGCVVNWFERAGEWECANALMMNSLENAYTMSADRLLNAARWFEDTPGTGARSALTSDHARALGKLVGRGAEKLGHPRLSGRFKNAIRTISYESARERVSRLVADLRVVRGMEVVPAILEEWVLEALKMRGAAAHSARTPLDNEPEVFSIAVHALEYLNTLFMLHDLPLSQAALRIMTRYPLRMAFTQRAANLTPAQFRQKNAARPQ